MRKARVLKRVLLILLCAAFIAALPVNFVKAADNESTERNVLNEKSDDITEVRSSKASAAVKTGEAKVSFLIAFVRAKPDGSSKIRAIYWYGKTVNVVGAEGIYSKIEYGSSGKEKTYAYIYTGFLSFGKGITSNFNCYHIKAGDSVDVSKLFSGSDYKATIESGSSYISLSGGKVYANNPGVAVVKASRGAQAVTCTVCVFYKWTNNLDSNYEWTTKTLQETSFYYYQNASEVRYTLPAGQVVRVRGDDGGSGQWAYVFTNYQGSEKHGFVKIKNISTKNTESYYNKMNFGYPTKSSTNYISSPYSQRSSDKHRGFDLTANGKYIYGDPVYAVFDGEVVYRAISYNSSTKLPDTGYCISIKMINKNTGNGITDPVTGKEFIATYMHLSKAPTLSLGKRVQKGDILGYIGNTGNVLGSEGINPAGTHLHFEVNNINATLASNYELRRDFTYNINPIFFYLNKKFSFNTSSGGYVNAKGAYWYGPNN